MRPLYALNTALLVLAASSPAVQYAVQVPPESARYSSYLEQDFPNQVLFGDTHLHTAYSVDAGPVLATLPPDDAYRFAEGQAGISSLGIPARLQRPLDWLVVTDHAENLGLPVALTSGNPVMQANEWSRSIAEAFAPGTIDALREAYGIWFNQVNEPGAFTSFIGFEWTSSPTGNNLHRNAIFRDGKDKADQVVPLSTYDTEDPEKLWDWLQAYEDMTGGQVLALAHNGNLSNGLMFDDVTSSGKPLSVDYALRRQRWEPIYEVTQIKGDGEAHPLLSPDDEIADFETWDKGSFGTQLKTPEMLPREYAREALKRGLGYERELGENPFKFGMLGSTDSHTGLSTASEDNFFGKVSALEPTNDPLRMEKAITGAREAIFDLACAGDRGVTTVHRCDAEIGNTVDPDTATYANSIGAPVLEAHWTNPDFDPDQSAFYYVRVIEIPTPRWTTIDAKVFGVEVPPDIPVSVQDRAYTSPIWYTPG